MADEATAEELEQEEQKNQDGFEAAFNEIAEQREAGPSDNPDDLEPPDEHNTSDDERAGAEEGATDTPEAEGDSTTDKAVTAEDNQPDAGAGKEEPAGEEENPFEGWPQEAIDRYNSQLEQNKQLQHRLESDSGRVSAFQRKVNTLEAQLKELTDAGGDQPSKDDIATAMSTDAKWEQFKEDYPDIAEVMESMTTNLRKDIDNTLAPVVEKHVAEETEAAKAAEQKAANEVAKDYPSWQDEVKKQEYHDWIATQSPGVQALGASDDVKDASLLVGLYDEYRVSIGRPSMKPDPEPDNGVTNKADELAERRRQQLEDGTTLPSKPARVDESDQTVGGFEQAFNAFAARKEAARRQ